MSKAREALKEFLRQYDGENMFAERDGVLMNVVASINGAQLRVSDVRLLLDETEPTEP